MLEWNVHEIKSSMTKPVCVNVKRFENASEIGGLTPEPASVNALTLHQNANGHNFTTDTDVGVNASMGHTVEHV